MLVATNTLKLCNLEQNSLEELSDVEMMSIFGGTTTTTTTTTTDNHGHTTTTTTTTTQ